MILIAAGCESCAGRIPGPGKLRERATVAVYDRHGALSHAMHDGGRMTTWSAEALATFWAAILASVIGVGSITATALSGSSSRKSIDRLATREQTWTRWSWTIEKALSENAAEREMGLAMMDALVDMPWLSDEDRRIALAIANAVIARNEHEGEVDE